MDHLANLSTKFSSKHLVHLCPSILEFWFGGDERAKYRGRWFPGGDESSERRVDEEVCDRFGGSLDALAQLEWPSGVDELLHDAVGATPIPREWYMALIVLSDQFSRHVYRLRGLPLQDPQRQHADAIALRVADRLTARDAWDQGLSMSQYVFALMPYRHSANVSRLETVLCLIERRETLETWSGELLSRFRKQTVRRLQHLQDRAKSQEFPGEILEREQFDSDESAIMSEPLVETLRDFLLEQHPPGKGVQDGPIQQPRYPIIVSLSGGVDSMVVSKILCVLRDRCPRIAALLPNPSPTTTSLVAIHIDYANRPESSAEADYLDSWCTQLGINFHKRVVSEVTRGVTDRTVYEAVSRDARYSFYSTVLAETKSLGVIFGHHQGDVQENVISNVLHGKSCLQLSGMKPVGVSNNVVVWRPLLQHTKDEIYSFAHKYGVPYFKDTTPSWSTRGKLRSQLLPLLIEIYGTGCLHNLSALADESDRMSELVDVNIFEPFTAAVTHHPCGLSVNVLPFRMQPAAFWKEALKSLMHSLSMSMVRGRAVGTFLERIQGSRARSSAGGARSTSSTSRSLAPPPRGNTVEWGPPGWIELRKGFHVELGQDGLLVIFKEGVLHTTRHSRATPDDDDDEPISFPFDPSSLPLSLAFDSWNVLISRSSATEEEEEESDELRGRGGAKPKPLQRIRDLLVGEFSYDLSAPSSCKALVVLSSLTGGRKSRSQGAPPPALTGMDLRLRAGLPLLVPAVDRDERDGREEWGDDKGVLIPPIRLKLHYKFRPY